MEVTYPQPGEVQALTPAIVAVAELETTQAISLERRHK